MILKIYKPGQRTKANEIANTHGYASTEGIVHVLFL